MKPTAFELRTGEVYLVEMKLAAHDEAEWPLKYVGPCCPSKGEQWWQFEQVRGDAPGRTIVLNPSRVAYIGKPVTLDDNDD